jgi:hypothetical protein
LDADLWAQFHEQHNEMIITKSGRCLFPCLRFKILGLDPNSYYSMRLDFEMLTPNRFRFYNGAWKPVEPLRKVDDSYSTASHDSTDSNDYSTATTSGHLRESYIHPDRFQLGSHWMANPISFTKVKMTNKVESPSRVAKRAALNQRTDSTASATNGSSNGDLCGAPTSILSSVHDINTNVFHMTSFHKYCPRIYLTQRAKGSNEIINSIVYRFDRTEFMAVTHYQNYKVKDLKKSYNPHAKGFRGTIGKVLPPVKFPAATKQHYQEELDKHPFLTKLARPRKRTRSSWRSDEGDSDEGMDGDYDPDSEEADTNEPAVMDSVGAMMGGSRSGMQAATVGASMTRVLEENISPNCRLDKDNDTLVTISLGKDGQGDAKISERTTQHYFDQNASLNGNAAVQIPEFYSRATTSATSWMGERSLPPVQNSSGDSFMRSRHFNGINQHQYQNHRQQQSQQQSLLLSPGSNKKIGDEQQRNPPLQSLFFNRAPTVRMDRVPTHLSDTTRDTLSMVSPPLHMPPMPNNTVVDGDDDNAANLLQLKQSIPSITLGPLENELMSDQNSSRVLSTELECSNLVDADASTTPALNTTPAPPPLSWYQQLLWDNNSANLSQNPAPTATSTASTVVPDDVDGSGIPLTLQQLAAMDSAAVDLVPSSTLNPHGVSSMQFPTGQIAYDDGCGNGVFPTMSIFGSGTSTPSLAIVASSAHSGPSSVTSGRSRAGPSISGDPYGYGLGGSGNHTGNSSSSGGGFNPDPRTLKTTILESMTFMPTSSVISILPVPGAAVAVEDTQQTRIDCLFHENLRLKAFIRERYGIPFLLALPLLIYFRDHLSFDFFY